MKRIVPILLLLAVNLPLCARSYDWAVGIRGSYMNGSVAAKHFFNEKNALDLSASVYFKHATFEVSAAYEWTFPIMEKMDFYVGPGLTAGNFHLGDVNRFSFGIEGIAGLEYNFGIPLAIFLDYRPRFNFVPGEKGVGFTYLDFGLGVKYRF